MEERIFCDPPLSEHDHTDKSDCYSFLGSDMIEIHINATCDKKVKKYFKKNEIDKTGYCQEESFELFFFFIWKKYLSVCRTGFDTRA